MRGTFFCTNLYFPNEKKNNIKLHLWIIMPSPKIFPCFPNSWIFMEIILLKQEFMAQLRSILRNFPTSLQTLRLRKLLQLKELGIVQQRKLLKCLKQANLEF